MASDTDTDGHSDPWEIAHQAEGYDPLIYDKSITFLAYVGEFTRGALCGEIEDDFFCKPGDMAYLAGNIASGVIAVGDIRDVVASVFKGDFVSAAWSVFFLIPFVGDATAWFKKTEKFIRVADDLPSGAALRSAMKDVGKSSADKMKLLRDVSPNAVTKLKAADVDDDAIVRLASRMISAKHFDDMVRLANDVRKADQRYGLEKEAEEWLRKQMRMDDPNVLEKQILSQTEDTKRFLDILNPVTFHGIEVKLGRVSGVGRAGGQSANDVLLTAPGARSNVRTIAWDFFTSENGTIGPDEVLLQMLIDRKIPYALWVA